MSTRNPNLTGEARKAAAQTCRELYEQGATVRSVARRIGRSYGVTYKLLGEAGTAFRGRDGKPRKADS
ncbi:helix-turn-helix domain-containing protein [Streptomyces aquilus]|uniref:helix-turn-helix domain-containing protein n=1 Tax=Streptomyces aquilus TaxID=2548456 RepID=UPI0037D86CED